MISRDTIEEIRNRLDIVDVISDFVSLKKAGQNYKALSPFANEKTPSFFVVPAKGIFKDFSSGKGGDAITFVMEHEKMSYSESLRYLAKKYGVEIKEDKQSDESKAALSEREGLYILMNFAKDYYHTQLLTSEEGMSIGLSYFRERGFNDRTIGKFELGYALNGWENFSEEAIAKGYNKKLLEKTGLIVKKEEGTEKERSYDRFRGRVIFPVHNISGKVIAFGARMLGKEKNQPKYINSPETEIYHKSDVLYGLYQAKNAIRQQDVCYLVEGYTDVISLHQADVENVVSSSGTALTESQIKLIRRFTENITVLFDGDTAGIKAALRGIDMILKGGLNVRVVLFPDGEDPDSYSRKVGTTEFQKFLSDHTQDFVSYKISLHTSEVKNDPIKRSESLREIADTLALLPDEVRRAPYYRQVKDLLEIDEQTVINEINKIRLKRERDDKIKSSRELKEDEPLVESEAINEQLGISLPILPETKVYAQERETIRLLIKFAENTLNDESVHEFLLNELSDVEFSHPLYRRIISIIKDRIDSGQSIDLTYLLSLNDEEISKCVSEISIEKYSLSPLWSDKFKIFVPDEGEVLEALVNTNVLRFKFRVVQKMLEDNLKDIKSAEAENEGFILDELLDVRVGLKNAEKELANLLGIVIAR
ncbi:MAG: DNA primase [Cyclobacteriaceae bacterium]|nr:DNA primase [Cyclobacteriaceae bacterium]